MRKAFLHLSVSDVQEGEKAMERDLFQSHTKLGKVSCALVRVRPP
jgi:hypothetical protein